jgi:hypothetical protein
MIVLKMEMNSKKCPLAYVYVNVQGKQSNSQYQTEKWKAIINNRKMHPKFETTYFVNALLEVMDLDIHLLLMQILCRSI